MVRILVIGALGLVMAQGCAADPFDDAVELHRIDGMDLVTRNPELDLMVSRQRSATGQFCLSPETDAVPTQSVGFAFNYTGQGSASETSGDGAATLGGRSPSVLITREILYRTCEFILNHDISDDEALSLFQQALTTAQAIATGTTGTGTQALDEGPTAIAPPQ